MSPMQFGRRDDDQGPNALLPALMGRLHHKRRGHDDHGQIDRAGDVPDGRVGGHGLDDIRSRVDRVHGTVESGDQEVVEDFPSDRPPGAGCPDHRDRAGGEERPHRRNGGGLLPAFEALDSFGGDGGGEGNVDLPQVIADIHGEPALPEDLDHPVVLRQHSGLELSYAVRIRRLGQLADQDRSQSPPLVGVRDGQSHLGSLRSRREVDGVRHDVALPARFRHHGEFPVVIHVHGARRGIRQIHGSGEEP